MSWTQRQEEGAGRAMGVKVTDRGSRAAEFIGYRDAALAHAEPFPEWWAKHGE
ncbi:hypothetical protein [Streptomyces goshikiensis]|uniref:hypothetical protein n=1 Tax=Streptomyces goshikiensis TaxID=1942 RepID=UPI0036AD0B32